MACSMIAPVSRLAVYCSGFSPPLSGVIVLASISASVRACGEPWRESVSGSRRRSRSRAVLCAILKIQELNLYVGS
jgi:hypothetical protein